MQSASAWKQCYCEYFFKQYTVTRWKQTFGVELEIVDYVWKRYALVHLKKPLHLLWILNFLKVCGPLNVHAGIWRVNERTFSRKVFSGIAKLAEVLEEVCFVPFC